MILVVGATGDLGARVVRRLLESGAGVRCLVRSSADTTGLEESGAVIVVGDLTDPGSLPDACEGVETVVATATVIGRKLAGARRPTIREVDLDGMAALVDAAERAQVSRFVYLSYSDAEHSFGTPLEDAKIATEQRLRRSGMRAVVLRPDAFQEIHLGPLARFDVAKGKVAVMGRGDNPRRWVATDDVAALTAAVATEPDPPPVLTFGGPEPLSKNQAVAVAERATGRSFKVQHLPLPVVRIGARLLARPQEAMSTVFGLGLAQDLNPATWDDAPLRERGIRPRSATEWIESQATAQRP